MGQNGIAAAGRSRPAHAIDLPVRCRMPGARNRRGTGSALLQQRGHAASSQRDRQQGQPWRSRHPHPRSGRLARSEGVEGPAQHLADAVAAPIARAEQPGKYLAVHAPNWLSNRFKFYDDIVDHCCYAWNTLIDQPWKIMSIALRDWAYIGRSIRGLVLQVKSLKYPVVSSF